MKTKIISAGNIQLSIEEQEIERVNAYVYLGHKLRLDKENQKAEIPRRIGQNWAASKKLGFILKNKDVPMNLKKRVYDSCILPVNTYG